MPPPRLRLLRTGAADIRMRGPAILAALLAVGTIAGAAAPNADVVQSPAFMLVGSIEQGSAIIGTAPAGTVTLTLDDKPVPLAPDGRFLIGFDRDQGPSAALVATLANGSTFRDDLSVAARSWRIEHVDVARRPGGASEEFLRIRAGELQRIAAARAVNSDSTGWRQRFVLPAHGRFSGLFGAQRIYRGEPAAYHSGLDIAAGAGAAVVAPADGVVVLAGPPPFSLEGNLVIVDHGMGLNSAFLHLSRVDVQVGQRLRQGDPIGLVGATGRATGPHLHWSLMWRGARLDPQSMVTREQDR